jgi:hypothetical protein
MKWLAAVVVLLGACNDGGVRFVYRFSDSDGGQCVSNDCTEIPFPCDAFVQLRVIDPADPVTPLYSFCKEINRNNDKNLCAIANADFDTDLVLPRQTLQIQALVWPATDVRKVNDEWICPPGADVLFDGARGFPAQGNSPSPAAGGSTYFGPDDEVAVIEIDCTNLALSNNTCAQDETIPVTSTVIDFDTRLSVASGTIAGRYTVAVGEPTLRDPDENIWQLPNTSLDGLSLVDPDAPGPTWTGEIDHAPQNAICVRVTDTGAIETTSTIQCVSVPTTDTYILQGVTIKRSTLDDIRSALGTSLPGTGMTIGLVLDQNFLPFQGASVTGAADIRYLSEDRMTFTGVATSANGIFVSTSADFRTLFSVNFPQGMASAIGGAVEGTVTVVILQPPGL